MRRPEDRKTPGRKPLGKLKKQPVVFYFPPELISKIKKFGKNKNAIIQGILELSLFSGKSVDKKE